jgi:hypothetical protein
MYIGAMETQELSLYSVNKIGYSHNLSHIRRQAVGNESDRYVLHMHPSHSVVSIRNWHMFVKYTSRGNAEQPGFSSETVVVMQSSMMLKLQQFAVKFSKRFMVVVVLLLLVVVVSAVAAVLVLAVTRTITTAMKR